MSVSARNYWSNLVRLLRHDRMLRPLVVAYYVTTRCNLNCAYCEDFAWRNPQVEPPPLSCERSPGAARDPQRCR